MYWTEAINSGLLNQNGYEILVFQQAIVPIGEYPNKETYQPTFYELLARLKTPYGVLNAGKWIDSIATDNDLMHRLDVYMLKAAARLHQTTGHRYTVNIGNATLRQPYIFQTISQDICYGYCPVNAIALEISERDEVQDFEQKILAGLKHNHTIYLDDIGAKRTNHASLSYVTEDWVGGIKLDRDFINKLSGNTRRRSNGLIGSLFAFCAGAHLFCICEGVEDDLVWENLLILRSAFADGWMGLFVQGWGVGLEERVEL